MRISKNTWTLLAVAAWLALQVAWVMPLEAAEKVLASGETHTITATDADVECRKEVQVDPHIGPMVSAACPGEPSNGVHTLGAGEADVFADTDASPERVVGHARATFRVRFRVQAVPGAVEQSFVPVHVRVPVGYAADLANSIPSPDPFQSAATINVMLRLRRYAGTVVDDDGVFGASNRGTDGCLVMLSDNPISPLTNISDCVTGDLQRYRGNASATLSALVEAGHTYVVELELRGDLRKRATTPLDGSVMLKSGRFELAEPAGVGLPEGTYVPGLRWHSIVVTIGTDPAAVLADLQEQIDNLRRDLALHSHTYLTGRGTGHNNTEATTGAALLPVGGPILSGNTSPTPGSSAPPAPTVATFGDVSRAHLYFPFVEALAASGITTGCSVSPPLYCPDAPVTRGQMAVFLSRALGLRLAP